MEMLETLLNNTITPQGDITAVMAVFTITLAGLTSAAVLTGMGVKKLYQSLTGKSGDYSSSQKYL